MNEVTEKQKVITYSVDVLIAVGIIALLAYFSLTLILPFLTILVWAAILAIALSPVFEAFKRKTGMRGSWASVLFALAGLTILLIPSYLALDSMADSLDKVTETMERGDLHVPPPNVSVKEWPLVGNKIYEIWQRASVDLTETAKAFSPQIKSLGLAILGAGASLAVGVLQFALSVVFAAVFLATSLSLKAICERIAARISHARGTHYVKMAAATVQNVSRGVIGVALIQGTLGAIGFLLAGLPFAGFLSVIFVMAAIVQVPPLVIIPAIIYVWSVEPTLFAVIFTAYMLPVMFVDNVLKPILMARGLETPMVVILIGVIGGTLSMGLLGLFIGPVILALFHKLVTIWMAGDDIPDTPADQASSVSSKG
jgi:predicted PurR-regulated permease PerM